MNQISRVTIGFELANKTARRGRVSLDEINLEALWMTLVGLIQPFASGGTAYKGVSTLSALETMLRVHFKQKRFALSVPAMEDALLNDSIHCEFARLDPGAMCCLPGESTKLRFSSLLDYSNFSIQRLDTVNATQATTRLKLKSGKVVDDALVAATNPTMTSTGRSKRGMHQTKKGNRWRSGMMALIEADADSGLVLTDVGAAANLNDVTQAHRLLHGTGYFVNADAAYQDAAKRAHANRVDLHVAMRPGQHRAQDWGTLVDSLREKTEQIKSSVRAKLEYPLQVNKVRYGGLAKKTAHLVTLFALSHLWMARRQLQGAWE